MGCPLAAAAFVLTLHEPLHQIPTALARHGAMAFATAYMDDTTLFTHHHSIAATLQAAVTALNEVGLQLNQTKTECWINDATIPYDTTYNNIPRAKHPTILRSTMKLSLIHI